MCFGGERCVGGGRGGGRERGCIGVHSGGCLVLKVSDKSLVTYQNSIERLY